MMTESTVYIDRRGRVYAVVSGLGMGLYKARYWKPGKDINRDCGKCVGSLPWRHSKDEAQTDLDIYAHKHNMTRYY